MICSFSSGTHIRSVLLLVVNTAEIIDNITFYTGRLCTPECKKKDPDVVSRDG